MCQLAHGDEVFAQLQGGLIALLGIEGLLDRLPEHCLTGVLRLCFVNGVVKLAAAVVTSITVLSIKLANARCGKGTHPRVIPPTCLPTSYLPAGTAVSEWAPTAIVGFGTSVEELFSAGSFLSVDFFFSFFSLPARR